MPMKKKKLTKSEKKRIRKERKEYNKQEDLIVGDSPIFRHKYRHRTFYCPICEQRFDTSDYLSSVFKGNDKAMWLANMVMHYRHNHITSWNKYWGWNGRAYREAAHFGDYDTEKSIVNERAKRQIARKCPQYIINNGINASVYSALQGTTEETLKVVDNVWSKHQQKNV